MTHAVDESFAIEAGTASIYIAAGFERACKKTPWAYDICADRHSGHIGIMTYIASLGVEVEKYLRSLGPDFEFDGPFHYEYTELMGEWLLDNPMATSEEFMTELQRIHKLSYITQRVAGKHHVFHPGKATA